MHDVSGLARDDDRRRLADRRPHANRVGMADRREPALPRSLPARRRHRHLRSAAARRGQASADRRTAPAHSLGAARVCDQHRAPGTLFILTEPDQYIYNPSFHFKLMFMTIGGPQRRHLLPHVLPPCLRPRCAARRAQAREGDRGHLVVCLDRRDHRRPAAHLLSPGAVRWRADESAAHVPTVDGRDDSSPRPVARYVVYVYAPYVHLLPLLDVFRPDGRSRRSQGSFPQHVSAQSGCAKCRVEQWRGPGFE